jgi:hypothetical protein
MAEDRELAGKEDAGFETDQKACQSIYQPSAKERHEKCEYEKEEGQTDHECGVSESSRAEQVGASSRPSSCK